MDKKSIIKDYFREIGARGGKSTSEEKLRAVAENAKRPRPGGRIPDDQLTDAQRRRRIYAANRKAKLEAENKAASTDAE